MNDQLDRDIRELARLAKNAKHSEMDKAVREAFFKSPWSKRREPLTVADIRRAMESLTPKP